eukprot:113873-Rhodomonas_salina.1
MLTPPAVCPHHSSVLTLPLSSSPFESRPINPAGKGGSGTMGAEQGEEARGQRGRRWLPRPPARSTHSAQ